MTLVSLPVVGGVTLWLSQNPSIALSVAGGFVFSGLMFGPDLDIYSVQYKRWGILRWIWRPYQKGLRHRSWLSHGFLVGTVLRLAYLGGWILLLGMVAWAIAHRWVPWRWDDLQTALGQRLYQYHAQALAVMIGLELGAMSHTGSDVLGSAWKKWRRRFRQKR